MRVKVLWFFSLFMVFSGLLYPVTPSEAVEINGFDNTRLAVSGDVICVINSDSNVTCRDSGNFEERPAPLNLGSAVSIEGSGDGKFCAITTARNLRCWGYDSSSRFVLEPPGIVKQISVNSLFVCAVNLENRLACWGWTDGFQAFVPPDLGEIKQVKTNAAQICVIDMTNLGKCWKVSGFAISGLVIPSALGKVKQIEIETNQICILDFSDRVLCSWGLDGIFQNLAFWESLPAAKFISESSVGSTSCLVSQLGDLTCWYWYKKQDGSNVPLRANLTVWDSDSPSIKVSEVAVGSGKMFVLAETGYVRRVVRRPTNTYEVLPNVNQFGQIFTPIKHVGNPSVSVTGKFIVGQLIKSKVDNWDPGFTTYFQWIRSGIEIEGQIAPNYRLRIEDIGSVISLRVAGSRYGAESFEVVSNELSINKATINGSPCSDSKKKSVDGWADVTDWKNTGGLPAITGKTEFGKSVKGNYGGWNKGITLCSFWSVGNGDYLKDSGGILKLTGREVGQSLRLVVLGRNKSGIAVVRFSNEKNVSKAAFPSTLLPKISTVQVGKPITIQPNWASGTKYTCEWGTATSSQSEDSRVFGCTYTPKPSDLDYGIGVTVCGTHANYISFCRGGLVGVTLPPDMPKIGLVKIATKSPKVGSILKGEVSGFMEGITIESQWLANGVPITSANNSDFQVPGSLKGSSISYKVTVSLPGYMTITKVSSPVKIP